MNQPLPTATPAKPPKVYVILLNWNGWRDTVECMESVFRQDYARYQVVVCDNDSKDQSLQHLRDWAQGRSPVQVDEQHPLRRLSWPNVAKPVEFVELSRQQAEAPRQSPLTQPLILIQTGANLGFAGGNNVGMRFALAQGDADYVWILNNDTVVEADALQAMVNRCESAPPDQPMTCGSLVCFYSDPQVIQAMGGSAFNTRTGIASMTLGRFRRRDESIDHAAIEKTMAYVTGCTWLLPIRFLQDVGLMEEGYFLYYEEIDWVMRAGQRFGMGYAPDSIVYHKEGSSIGSKTMNRAPSLFAEFYMTRSKLLFMRRFFPGNVWVVYLSSLAQAANRVRQGHAHNARMILRALLGRSFK